VFARRRARALLTISGSRWCSINAENSTRRSLCVAIARPSQGGTLGGWISEDTAVDGGFRAVDPPLGYPWANGFTLRTDGKHTDSTRAQRRAAGVQSLRHAIESKSFGATFVPPNYVVHPFGPQ